MTGAGSSSPAHLTVSCWAVGGEGFSGLVLKSLLSKPVYVALFSSSQAFWHSCVPWLVFVYFPGQLNDGLPTLKSPRCWQGAGSLEFLVSGLSALSGSPY